MRSPPLTVVVAVTLVAAAAWRLALGAVYYGWEESDYGNLAMIHGVLEGGFLHYDMNHLPLYYGLSAVVMAVVGDAVVAGRVVSLAGGLVAIGLALWLAERVAGRRATLLVAPLLVFQPELALYSASQLREPPYAAAVAGSVLLLVRERLGWAGLCAGLAFLVRMDPLVALAPALTVHALGRGPRLGRLVRVWGPLLAVVAAWSVYCRVDHGTFAFWGHSVAVNLETGGNPEAGALATRLATGLPIALGLLVEVLPTRIGWGPWIGLPLALVLFVPWREHGPARTLALAAGGMLGFWAGVGLLAQHDLGHNLYWKWLTGSIPLALVLGVAGVWAALGRLRATVPGWVRWALLALALTQALVAMGLETRRQLQVSERLYRPQLELARWIEAEVPESTTLLVDNIPGVWIDRRDHRRELWSWFDVPVPPGDADAFSAWVRQEQVGYVLWFVEDWTQAPVVAPWLSKASTHEVAGVTFTPLREDDAYGWIFYRVDAGP